MSEKNKHGGFPLGRPGEKAKNFKGTVIRLSRYLRPQLGNLIAVGIFAVFSTTFMVLGPRIAGDAINQITDGFIAKSIVNGIAKAQPELKKTVRAYDDALASAVKKADEAAERQFNATLAARRQKAYAEAIAKADAAAEQEFADAASAQRQAALAKVKRQAEAAAKAAVDARFTQMAPGVPVSAYPTIPGYGDALQAAYAQADAQANAAVADEFAKRQAAMTTKLAQAKVEAEKAAKNTVDSAFAQQQAAMAAKLASAKAAAEKTAKAAVTKAFLQKMNVTQAQFDTVRSLAALPAITSVADYGKRSDIARSFVNGIKKLPASLTAGNSALKSSDVQISNVSGATLAKYVTTIRKNGGKMQFDAIAKTLLSLLAIYLLSSLFTFAMQFIMSTVAQGVVYELRRDLDGKLSRLPLRYYDSHSNGEILSRMTNDIDTISGTLQQSLTQLITALLQMIGYIIMMLTISPLLTLIVLTTMPLYIAVTLFIAKNSQKFYTAQQKHLGDISGHTEEMFTGHRIVKAFGQEQNSVKTFEAINGDLYRASWKAQFLSGVMFPVMNFISNVGYVLICVVGGIFVTKTWLNIGDITAFITYSRSFSQPIVQTANIANVIQSTVACAERVFEVLDEEEEIPDSPDAIALTQPRGDIVFDHVKFSYKKSEPLIENMNLSIRKGDTVAIVGPTGAGKTTLVNLLLRFYEILGGSITFDGVDLRRLKRGSLRRMFGMVLQDTWLFNGSIEDNIRYGRMDATHQEIVQAAKAAYADHFIRSLPDGYNTVLNEEASNISQGQKQLLTIARAILADPTVLILDEATSSVDTRTEVLIQNAMSVLMRGRTNFVIAHRLSTIRNAKTILVMNCGSIIEKGSHRELMEKNGFYADLYNSQFAGPAQEDRVG